MARKQTCRPPAQFWVLLIPFSPIKVPLLFDVLVTLTSASLALIRVWLWNRRGSWPLLKSKRMKHRTSDFCGKGCPSNIYQSTWVEHILRPNTGKAPYSFMSTIFQPTYVGIVDVRDIPKWYWKYMKQFNSSAEFKILDPVQRQFYLTWYCRGRAVESINWWCVL